MSKQKVQLRVSKPTAECISPAASKETRLLAAAGKLPVKPDELIIALYFLAHDGDEEVRELARTSIKELPKNVLIPVLESTATHPKILDYLSRTHSDNLEIMHSILQNASTEDSTILRFIKSADQKCLDKIDLHLLKEKPEILEAISHASPALMNKINSLIAADEEREATDSVTDPDKFPNELINEDSEESDEENSASIYKQILKMGVSERIKLAITGNKEARGILIKDPNRLVCGNVMKNPRITESEVVLFSASKNVSEEVFRLITANRDWIKNYTVKFNLVSNPRVPLPVALRFLNHLRDKDLEILSKSRNVSKSVANMARRTLASRREKK